MRIGKKFHYLTVTSAVYTRRGRRVVRCRCRCGTVRRIRTDALLSGATLSCGCWHRKRMKQTHTRHGAYKTKLYKVWNQMLQRCGNPNNRRYGDYGGRGIKVCKSWLTFAAFQVWAKCSGYRAGLSIDRRNNGLGYRPSNCQWSTRSQQQMNQRARRSSRTGVFGVHYDKTRRKFRVELRRSGERIFVGRFDTLQQAVLARKKAA